MTPVERNSSAIEKKQQQSISDYYYTNKTKNGGDDALSTSTSSTASRSSYNGSTLPRKNSTMMVILMVFLGQTLIFGTKVITIANEKMFGADDAGKEQMVLERQNDQQRQQQVSRTYPPHIPSFPPGILEIIKSTNSSDYTWLGNQFVPPPGVPIFTPSQIRTYFQQRNVLMLGDSTNRRAYGTLLAILNAEDLDDVNVAALEEVQRRRRLSAGKYRAAAAAGSGTNSDCGPRNNKLSIPRRLPYFSCANVIGSSAEKYASVTHSDVDNHNSTQHEGFFDIGKANCFHTIEWLFTSDDKSGRLVSLEDYDLVIINNGIWEDLNMGECSRNATSGLGLLPEVLDRIRDGSSKDLQVVLRTSGFSLNRKNGGKSHPDLIWNLTNYSKNYFHNISMIQNENKAINGEDHAPNMTLVDFSTVISKRSFGETRIRGDHVAHYGYEARTLYVQQLMHELIRAELEK